MTCLLRFQKMLGFLAAALMILVTGMMLSDSASAEEINFSPGQINPTGGQNIGEFAISPDGTQVAMVARLDNGVTDRQQTFVAGLLSGVANPATLIIPDGAGDVDSGVRWTPDGLSVVTRFDYNGVDPDGVAISNEFYLLPANGDASGATPTVTPQRLTFGSANAYDPQISSDGSTLIYSDGGSLYSTPIAGASATSAIQLNPGGISEMDLGTSSLVGTDVFFSGFSTPVPGATNATREDTFYRTAADGSTALTPTNIPINNMPTDTTLNFTNLEVTPDGQKIIFRGDMLSNGITELFSIPTAGGDFEPLFPAPRANFDVNLFKISNDGSMIAFVSDYLTDTIGELFIVDTDGGTPRRVSDSAHFAGAPGTPFDVAFTGDKDRIQFSPDDDFVYYVADGGSDGDHNSIFTLHRVPTAPVPEPSALPLLFAAFAFSFFLRRRR